MIFIILSHIKKSKVTANITIGTGNSAIDMLFILTKLKIIEFCFANVFMNLSHCWGKKTKQKKMDTLYQYIFMSIYKTSLKLNGSPTRKTFWKR